MAVIEKERNETKPEEIPETKPMTRIQVEFSPERRQQLEQLMGTLGIRTKKELLNSALTMFTWAADEVKNGRSICSIDEEEKRIKEYVNPIFANLKH